MQQVMALNDVAKERGQTLAQMALSWNLKDGDITSVLIGASRPEQITDCMKCIENTTFSQEELQKINQITGV